MKIALFLAFILASFCGQGQSLNIGIGAGYGTKKSPVIDLRVKVEADGYFLQFGFASNSSQRVNVGTVFYGGGGYDIGIWDNYTISPLIGYQHTLCSNDRPEYNITGYLAGVTVSHYMWDGGSLYLSALNTKNQTVTTFGISVKL